MGKQYSTITPSTETFASTNAAPGPANPGTALASEPAFPEQVSGFMPRKAERKCLSWQF